MAEGDMADNELTRGGGCQCGRVRFEAQGKPIKVTNDDTRRRLERLVAVTRSGRRQYAPRQPKR